MNLRTEFNFRGIPRSIWALGLVSMCMDISSEMIHGLLPVFMVTALGASATAVGAVEGIAEATAQITKVFSGPLSDYLGKRKLITLIGYGISALSKPLVPMAESVGMVMAARFIDRTGKGIRGAPRDALIGDIAPPERRGACFGLRQSLDTVGAFIGPFLAMFFLLFLTDNVRHVLWFSVLPALCAVLLLAFGVQEPASAQKRMARSPLRLSELRALGRPFWNVVLVAAFLSLARFSEAFLILRVSGAGVAMAYIPLTLVLMNVFYALAAYPAGVLSDRMPRQALLVTGGLFLVAADLALAFAPGLWVIGAGIVLWGMHMAFSQGILAALVADHAPAHLRGTAYGFFNLASGIAALLSSLIAGVLWDRLGAGVTFLASACFASISMLLLILLIPRQPACG